MSDLESGQRRRADLVLDAQMKGRLTAAKGRLTAAKGRLTAAVGVVLAFALLLSGAGLRIAFASAAPTLGRYHATGGIAFSFRLATGTCPAPPKNFTNPSARYDKPRRGVCFDSTANPLIKTRCPDGSSLSGEQAGIGSFTGTRLASNGTLHERAYAYSQGPRPVGFVEIYIKVVNARATGYVRATQQVSANDVPVTCDSGNVHFTARRR